MTGAIETKKTGHLGVSALDVMYRRLESLIWPQRAVSLYFPSLTSETCLAPVLHVQVLGRL